MQSSGRLSSPPPPQQGFGSMESIREEGNEVLEDGGENEAREGYVTDLDNQYVHISLQKPQESLSPHMERKEHLDGMAGLLI